jgi:hypothetical protein
MKQANEKIKEQASSAIGYIIAEERKRRQQKQSTIITNKW